MYFTIKKEESHTNTWKRHTLGRDCITDPDFSPLFIYMSFAMYRTASTKAAYYISLPFDFHLVQSISLDLTNEVNMTVCIPVLTLGL